MLYNPFIVAVEPSSPTRLTPSRATRPPFPASPNSAGMVQLSPPSCLPTVSPMPTQLSIAGSLTLSMSQGSSASSGEGMQFVGAAMRRQGIAQAHHTTRAQAARSRPQPRRQKVTTSRSSRARLQDTCRLERQVQILGRKWKCSRQALLLARIAANGTKTYLLSERTCTCTTPPIASISRTAMAFTLLRQGQPVIYFDHGTKLLRLHTRPPTCQGLPLGAAGEARGKSGWMGG